MLQLVVIRDAIFQSLRGERKSADCKTGYHKPIGLIVSGIGVHKWHANNHLEWIDSSPVYSTVKYYADVWLERSGLDYTIIRPGSPTNNRGTVAGDLEHKQISREDVASAIIASLENDQKIGKAFDLVGGVTPIEEALRTL